MKVLWVSRHELSVAQMEDLRRIYGEVEIKKYDQTVKGWKDVVEAGEDCEVLAVVLPPALLADLVNPRNNSKPVIRSRMTRVPTGKTVLNPATGKEEQEVMFVHEAWEQILKIDIVTKDL